MNSRDWTEELTAYIDGELDPETAKAVELELTANPKLKSLEQQLRRTVALMAQVPVLEPSRSLRRSVLSKVEVPTLGERVRGFLTPGRLVPVGALAMAGLAALVVVRGRDVSSPVGPVESEEQLVLAQNMELVEDLDLVGLEKAGDLDVVAGLNEQNEGKTP